MGKKTKSDPPERLKQLVKESEEIDKELTDIERDMIVERVATGAMPPQWAAKLLKPEQEPERKRKRAKGGGAKLKLKPAQIAKGSATCRRLLAEEADWADDRDALARRVLELEQFGVSWKTVRRRIVDPALNERTQTE